MKGESVKEVKEGDRGDGGLYEVGTERECCF